jgi:sulfur carrier protein ThiS
MKSKKQIAREIYGVGLDNLTPGEKASVTRRFNAQEDSYEEDVADTGIVYVKVARLGVNGTKECAMNEGSTVADLLAQSGYTLDAKKEKMVATSTGLAVDKDDIVENGEAYTIMPEVKSA